MSGIESSTSTPSLPPADPPPTLPTGVEAPHDGATAGDLLLTGTVHLGAEAAAAGLEESLVILGTGGALSIGGMALGTLASTAGWGYALFEMAHAIGHARSEGGREGLLDAALGGHLHTPQTLAWGAGLGAVMLDMSEREIATLASRLPELDGVRAQFLDAVAHARECERTDAPGWEEARAEYRDIFRAWSDGHAAAIGGWDTPGRGEVFRAARAEMAAYLESHPDEAATLRAHYRADVREGFIARDAGAVDEHRYLLDASYRAGVEYRRSLEGADLDRARHDIVGISASSLTLGRFMA